ncbi:MAG: beta-glucanase (GH16 family) [Lentisphaeria bacterium]|jgi:beta-glucanase (GH16 family)
MQKRTIFRHLVAGLALTCGLITAAFCHAEPTLVWADEFDTPGLPDPTKWSYNVGILGFNQELQYYSKARSENARVNENGLLVIEARKEPSPEEIFGAIADYTSARLVSKGKGDWQYGRFEVRAKLPYGRGTWPAIWMLASGNAYGGWPHSGEIDIMEHVGSDMNTVLGTLHNSNFHGDEGPTKSIVAKNVDTAFHVYAVEWRPNEMRFFLDDTEFHTHKNPQTGWKDWPYDKPFHFILNIAVGGTLGGKKGIDADIWPQKMEIDYVRVYDLGDSPKLDNDKDGLVDSIDPDDDNDGIADFAEVEAGSNPYDDKSFPQAVPRLLRNADFGNSTDGWNMRSLVFSASGELIDDVFGGVHETDVVRVREGAVTFKHTGPQSGKEEKIIFQNTDIKQGLKPGDIVTFRGRASANISGDTTASAHIYVYTADGGSVPASVSTPIGAKNGEFQLTTTLRKGPVKGVALGFEIQAANGKSGSITFAELSSSIEKSENVND